MLNDIGDAFKYLIITPAKNEERYIAHTLESVCNQTVKPAMWVIVDDGSTDKTPEIVREYCNRYAWIRLVKNETAEETRAGGAKVVRAFCRGYATIEEHAYAFVAKLDADLTLPEKYFETIADCFDQNPKLGICGGFCVNTIGNKIFEDKSAEYHVRGALKAYRKECFDAIGGIRPVLGWDGLDEFTAMYHGWEIKVIDTLQVLHHRPTGKETGPILLNFKLGLIAYRMGYDFILATLRAAKRSMMPPIIIGGLPLLYGYMWSMIKRDRKYVNKDMARYIRRFHYNRIRTFFKVKFITNMRIMKSL